MLVDLFGPQGSLTWWQECDRTIVIFVYGLLMVRLVGRRVFGKWGALDIVVSIVFGSSLSRALTGGAPMGGTIAAMTLLLAMHWFGAQSAARWELASRLFEGAPEEVARDGKLNQRAVLRHSISHHDLDEALRAQQVQDLTQAKRVVVEPSGKINVQKA